MTGVVNFVRYDPNTGEIASYGHMHYEHVVAEHRAGGHIVITDRTDVSIDEHKVDLHTGLVVNNPNKRAPPKPLHIGPLK
jgi:hypothetical protein